jgi:hypothetical protein
VAAVSQPEHPTRDHFHVADQPAVDCPDTKCYGLPALTAKNCRTTPGKDHLDLIAIVRESLFPPIERTTGMSSPAIPAGTWKSTWYKPGNPGARPE